VPSRSKDFKSREHLTALAQQIVGFQNSGQVADAMKIAELSSLGGVEENGPPITAQGQRTRGT
jgi:hypothetical protein